MKWVLLAVVALVLLVGLAAMVGGAMLPRSHHATRKTRLRVSPEALYAVLAGPPDWRTGVRSFGVLPEQDGRKRWWEEDTHRQKVTFELVEDQPPARLAVRIAGRFPDGDLPFGGTWTFEIAPAEGGGSDLRIREDGEIYNVIFRFMARFFFGYTASIEGYLRDLGTKFHESVAIEP
ncbi:conserved exported hypothetical protein [Candidatus Sulfopaludibacter sp. SbA6]|nr:conserved exported hypothetical protein [Candidatus Sulfopaludibacter sp. SbA6]